MKTNKRTTIGVLFGFHLYEGSYPAQFCFPIIRGMQTAARDKDINLLVGCGVGLRVGSNIHRPAWPEVNPGMDFVPVGPWNTDGLVVVVPLLTEGKIRYTQKLLSEGFPLLYIGGDSGSPAIVVDNESGIHQVLEHLVQHGHKSIAFIAGDELDAGDSHARLKAYREGVEKFGLTSDPRLIEYGYHWVSGGYDSVRRMLASGVEFTAVMCSNDLSAAGAIRALREAGIRVPRDVAVTGFDDVYESNAQVPPLTTVHYPLFETGYRAMVMLQKRILQGPGSLPDLTRVGTWLVPRQSCGCMPKIVVQSAVGADPSQKAAVPNGQEFRNNLAQSMLDALAEENLPASNSELLPLCEQMADGFLASVKDGKVADFQNAVSDVLQQVEITGKENAHLWQSTVTALRRVTRTLRDEARDPDFREYIEDLLHQARTLFSDSTDRRYTRLMVIRTENDDNMGLLTAQLISSTDEEQIYGALRGGLPQVGVSSCNMMFFEGRGDDPVAGSMLRPLEPEAKVLRFETRQFPPAGLYPEGKAYSLALLPLIFRDERMGYVAFDGGNLDPLAMLVRQLASSLKNVQLHAKVLELSLTDGLTGVHNRRYFEIMLQKETERSRRYKRDLAVIMIDIDRFKLYNDAYGHPAGDEALKEIAECILRGARRGLDVVTRYGGEEFAVILPETDVEGARVVAEHMRKKVAENGKLRKPTTVSLGIASLRGEKISHEELVKEADRALYQAKAQGRNRTVVYEKWMADAAHAPKPPKEPAQSKPRKRKSSRRKT